MKMNNRKIVICVISVIFIGLLIYLPNNIHFRALCGDSDALVEMGYKLKWSENKNDQKKGYELLVKAANKENPDAIYLVGRCLFDGKGIEQSNLAGYNYFMRAYDLKSKISSRYKRGLLYFLGICFLEGKGTFQDIDKSIDMLLESAKLGRISANKELAIAYGVLALGICEKKEKEELIFFPDFYYTTTESRSSSRGIRSYQDSKNEYNKELNEKEKQYVSYGIKARAHSIIYSQQVTSFEFTTNLYDRMKEMPATYKSANNDGLGLEFTPARHKRAEIYAKEFQQSIKSDE